MPEEKNTSSSADEKSTPSSDMASKQEEKQENAPAENKSAENAQEQSDEQKEEATKDETKDAGKTDVIPASAGMTEDKKGMTEDKKDFSYLKPGMTVKVHQKITEAGKKKGETKERIQIFEGMILAIKNKGVSKTITVRKISEKIGVEKIFPLHLPTIVKIEPVKQAKVRRAKLYYLRDHKKKLKERKIK